MKAVSSPHSMANYQSSTCCICGGDDRIFEQCNTPGCHNIVCVDKCRRPCQPNIPVDTWTCAIHSGDGTVTYNANACVDILVLTHEKAAFRSLILSAARLAFHGYRLPQVALRQDTISDRISLINALDAGWRPHTSKWVFVEAEIKEDYSVWLNNSYDLYGFVRRILLNSNVIMMPIAFHSETTCDQLVDLLQLLADAVGDKAAFILTRPCIEAARIAHPLMRIIEMCEIMGKSVSEAVNEQLQGKFGTPVWYFAGGCGYYFNPIVAQCVKHPNHQRHKGRYCVGFGSDNIAQAMRFTRIYKLVQEIPLCCGLFYIMPPPPHFAAAPFTPVPFTPEESARIAEKLQRPLAPEHILIRSNGRAGDVIYIPGHTVTTLLNEVEFDEATATYAVGVCMRGIIRFQNGIVHEDFGCGVVENIKSQGMARGQAHKEAVTDTLKRIVRQLGPLFSCVYDQDYKDFVLSYHRRTVEFDPAQCFYLPGALLANTENRSRAEAGGSRRPVISSITSSLSQNDTHPFKKIKSNPLPSPPLHQLCLNGESYKLAPVIAKARYMSYKRPDTCVYQIARRDGDHVFYRFRAGRPDFMVRSYIQNGDECSGLYPNLLEYIQGNARAPLMLDVEFVVPKDMQENEMEDIASALVNALVAFTAISLEHGSQCIERHDFRGLYFQG
ncbi:hypothetical protein BC937DRAFT_94816 [Endogone sp. FLAS-F59071]|nr:hypothetical protein BC937DRAFT_94816 [Endogone sp. FLAS-F59071]|eukprot:RUS20611.1 hypothetical protein BC937DRAFT_94816 [Endogone sp. FLAS-F59071]